MNQPTSPSAEIAAFLPLFIIFVVLYFVLLAIAKRKGRSRYVALFAFIPLFNGMYALWLCSQTDDAILKRIEALERQNKTS